MKVMKRKNFDFTEKKWLKPYIDLEKDLSSKIEKKLQGNASKSININFCAKIEEKVRKKEW